MHTLYDFSPLLKIMLLGALLALLPLLWIAYRQRRGHSVPWAQALTLLTLFLTFDLILFGAFTRLTDSGLGCPDWPGCYGSSSPVGAHADILAAQSAMPSGPVTQGLGGDDSPLSGHCRRRADHGTDGRRVDRSFQVGANWISQYA